MQVSSRLAQDQSVLLSALAGLPGDLQASLKLRGWNLRGLQVYQANRAMLAGRTLVSTYPVMAQLIGVESFEVLARHFWQQHPPTRGDMGQWGEQLADFLTAAPQLAGEPFLSDVARIEWALHACASAPDAVLDAASFVLLTKLGSADDAPPVTLRLNPGTALFASAYPVVSIVQAHLAGQSTLQNAADLLDQGIGEYALVWRQGFKPNVRAVCGAEYKFVCALANGLGLDDALMAATDTDPEFDFTTWLAAAVQSSLVTAAIPVSL